MAEHEVGNSFALLTGQGRGAIGVVWCKGERSLALFEARFRPAGRRPLLARPPGAISYGVWSHSNPPDCVTEDVIVSRLGVDEFEVHTHGGRQAQESLRQTFLAAGFVELPATAWLSFEAGSDLSALAGQMLLRCETELAARWLLNQPTAWRQWCESFERKCANKDLAGAIADCQAVRRRQKLAVHLIQPWVVVLGGEPNAGKSSLCNALAGFARSLVHGSPGTTRDVVTQRLVLDGWPVELWDTAGQREAGTAIEASGIRRAREAWQAADCRIGVEDATRAMGARTATWEPAPDLLVYNKSDLPTACEQADGITVSALTGSGLETLQRAILDRLVPESTSLTCPLPLGDWLPRWLEAAEAASCAADWRGLERCRKEIRGYCGGAMADHG